MTHHSSFRLRPRAALASLAASLAAALAAPYPAGAQGTLEPVSRAQAVEAALARAPRLGVARADSAAAAAQLLTARAFANPTLAASYSKSVPQYHVSLDLPLDYPSVRGVRTRSAAAARQAARYRLEFERAAAALDADTSYTRALAALAHARLSRRNAADADSLRLVAAARRDAGDASDLDVALATVNAGQQANGAAADSLAFVSAVLDLQAAMGLGSSRVAVTPSDSLTPPPADTASQIAVAAAFPEPGARAGESAGAPAAGVPLQVAAAQAALESARLAAALERRSVFAGPSITAGFETGDPTRVERGLLPTVGIALPLPLLNRNSGPIAQAVAEQERARAELALATLESRTEITRALRAQAIALAKVERDRKLVTAADRVAAMSLTAYREGAAPLANVLEAQRNARDVLAQYVDDVAAAWTTGAALRALTLTSAGASGPPAAPAAPADSGSQR
jgi:cobalt-zinc-cadmium efflux system outer membrane protein